MNSTTDNSTLEYQIIGRLLTFPQEMQEALDIGLKKINFSDKDLGKLYEEMADIFLEKGSFDIAELNWEIDSLLDMIDNHEIVVISTAVQKLISISKENFLTKETEKILMSSENLDKKLEKILKVIEKVENSGDSKNREYDIKDLINEWYQELGKKENIINFPFSEINEIFNLEKGSLVTVGARPSMGKTAFGLNVAYRVAKEKPALYINLEMSRKQIINRLAAINSGVEYRKVERKTGSDEEITRINMAMSYLNDMNLKILDIENPDFKRIVNQIRRLHQRKKFDVIVIDYLTLMQSYGHQNKNLEVEYMSNRLKLLAKELDTCIIILAQLNRGVEARTDKRPILSDLRDSGGIEQASNVVAFLHREDYYDKEKKNIVNSEVEFIVRKNRSGELGTVHLGFHLPTQRMVEKRRG